MGLLDLSPLCGVRDTWDSREGGLETSLQAFQDTCVLFFFSFHYHRHSGESKHTQTNQTTRRQGGDGEGRAGRWGRSKVSAAGEMPFPRGCKEEGKQVCGHASEKERERGNLKQETQKL